MTPEDILLHCCCAPCSTSSSQRLTGKYRPILYFYNPNITPLEEYERRLEAMRQFAERTGLEVVEGPRDFDAWETAMTGLEEEPEGGSRCSRCFQYRLSETARFASENGYKLFTTSLTVSPHKRSQDVFAAGRNASNADVQFLAEDFKKKDGFRESIQLAENLGLYRQRDCGCRYSRRP